MLTIRVQNHNAVLDATGVRLRTVRFRPKRVKAVLGGRGGSARAARISDGPSAAIAGQLETKRSVQIAANGMPRRSGRIPSSVLLDERELPSWGGKAVKISQMSF